MILETITTVKHLYNASNINDKTAFYLHNGQYINDIVKSEGFGYTIYYSNGNVSDIVSGDTKIRVVKS